MYHGILALLGRSLRIDARSWPSHLVRFGLIVAIYVTLCVALWRASWFGAPGLQFFYGIAYLNLIFMSLMAISFFSTTISKEKEEDTLGLMMMAGISPLGILVGKSGGRLIQALLLVGIQYPFTLLAVTMGGVTQTQVAAVYLGFIAYMILLAGFGLLCSVVASTNRSAATWMIAGLAGFTFIPWIAATYLADPPEWLEEIVDVQSQPWLGMLECIAQFSVFVEFGTILTTGFHDRIWTWQICSNLVVGVTCFGLSWGMFGFFADRSMSSLALRGLVPRLQGWSMLRPFAPGRAWQNPFVWKDFHFVSGGYGMISVRLLFCVPLWGMVLITNTEFERVITYFQVFLSLAIAIDAGRLLAQSIHDEIRWQTLGVLMMLPQPLTRVIYSKFAGVMITWIPLAVVDLLVSVVIPEGRQHLKENLENDVGFCVISFFILIPNLSALLATYLRWGAVPLGTSLAVGLFYPTVFMLENSPSRGNPGYYVASVVGSASIVCHILIVRRLRRMAEIA